MGRDEVASITIVYNKNSFIRWPPILALRDIDESMFLPLVNHSLATKFARSNYYELLSTDDRAVVE